MTAAHADVNDQLNVSAPIGTDNAPLRILNGLLSGLWRASIQHQAHLAMIEALGLQGLADAMKVRTLDEPIAIRALLNRLVDLGGKPAFTIEAPIIGATVREILENDMELQRHARPKLNAAAEIAAAAHDATTRNLIEQILSDEEKHLRWLETETALYETLGESLYCASRLHAGRANAA